MKPVIFGLSGLTLTPEERAFFKSADPAGYILFGRNVESRAQLRALTDDLRALHGRDDLAILIDQEGGRVQRMKPPVWPAYPPAGAFDRLYDIAPVTAMEAARLNARAIAHDLHEVGITVDALPLLDVRQECAHDIIGDRALGRDPMRVAALGRAVLDGLAEGGVAGIVKHMPGHGRALADSHLELPTVTASAAELETDIAPFATLKDAAMAMTAHIIYTAWDAERCATLSPVVIGEIIRGRIGFDGLLMSDDMDMKALRGDSDASGMGDLAARLIAAGCDVALNCWARMEDMAAIVDRLDDMAPVSAARLDRAMAPARAAVAESDHGALIARRDALLALAA